MNLDWTEIAIDDYDQCILYLEKKLSEREVYKFIDLMDHTLELICKNPTTFPKSEYIDIRYVVVMKPITILGNNLGRSIGKK